MKSLPYRKPIFSFGSKADFSELHKNNPEKACVALAKFVTGKRKRSAVNRLLSLPADVLQHYALEVGFIHEKSVKEINFE